MENNYFDLSSVSDAVAKGRHRDIIGGLWDEIGALQVDFMKTRGLSPHHKLLDIGCGALRGGVLFVKYLDSGNYFGVDISQDLLDAGMREVHTAGDAPKLPPANLLCSDRFEFQKLGRRFDFALAQSVFTHLTFNRIRQCLEETADALAEGGVLYATFFERPAGRLAKSEIVHLPGRKRSYDVADPYHYSVDDLRYAASHLPLAVEYIGDWSHPRAQRMVAFRKIAE